MALQGNTNSLLRGVRVLDMSRVLAGPFMTMILGDMGADVIKVEKPHEGDETRSWGPPFCGTESAYFLSVNRNKRSIAVNLKCEKGIELIQSLAKESDILVENFIPGKLDSLGIGYDTMKKVNPRLVYCSISGFGSTGPYARRSGYDVIASSYGGLNYITGPENGEPCKVGVALTDICTGLYAHGAVIAALLQRKESGVGQKIDCDLLSCQISALTNISSSYLNAGVEAKRWGTGHASLVPYQAFKTKDDRYITVGATNNRQFKDLCEKMSLAHLSSSERFGNNEMRVTNRKELIKTMSERFQQKSCEEWLTDLEASQFPYGPINNMEQVFSDPQVVHNGSVLDMVHPTIGGMKVTAPPVKYGNHHYDNMRPPPTLGQHTDEVLKEIVNFSSAEINVLRNEGVVS